MAELPPALAASLRGRRPILFGTVEINLPGYDLLLLDGSGEVPIGNRRFVGRDPIYGVLDYIKGLSDAVSGQSQTLSIGLLPNSTAALATLCSPAVQGSPITVAIGSLDASTGLPVSDSYVLSVGELDVPTVNWGKNSRRLEYKCVTVSEKLFQVEEGKRLSDSWHQSIWPGELGCSMVTDVETYVPWGQKLDLTAVETRTNIPAMGQMTTKIT